MKIREIIGTDAYGTTVHGLVEGAKNIGFEVKAIKIKIEDIDSDYTLPAIAHVVTQEGNNHFIVISRIKKGSFIVLDPARGLVKQTKEELQKMFTGVLILLVPKSGFETNYEKKSSMWTIFSKVMLPQKRMLLTVIFCSIVLTLLGIVSSLFSKAIFDEIVPYHLKKTLYIYAIIFGVIGLIRAFLDFFRNHVLLFLSRKIDIPILLGYYNHILRLPFQFFSTRKVGDILTRFQDALTIKDIFSQLSISLVLDLFLAIFTGVALFRLNAPLFAIIILVVCINIFLIYGFKGKYKALNYEQMEANAFMNSQLIESIKNIETIKAYVNENTQITKLENRFVAVQKLGYSEGVLSNLQNFISAGAGSISNVILLGIGAVAIIDGKMSIGDLMVFQTLSTYFTEPIQNLVSLQLTYQEAQIAMVRLSELMDLDIEEPENMELLKDVDLYGDIKIKDLIFKYGSRPPVLNNINLLIKKGSRVAIVGESGVGKSTIAKLLMKFHFPNSGEILFNGYNVCDIKASFLREEIGYVPQNIELFTGTIFDNIKCGNENASYEQVVAATKLAGCYEFIQKLPNRFYSFVEENGGNFSGGERQRIAIARAFVKKRQLYIFDESTSNLDSFSERYIQDAMLKATQGSTTIIIAHRLSTIVNSDEIIFFARGEIKEQGTHGELMLQNGEYASMIKLQYGERMLGEKEQIKKASIQEEISY